MRKKQGEVIALLGTTTGHSVASRRAAPESERRRERPHPRLRVEDGVLYARPAGDRVGCDHDVVGIEDIEDVDLSAERVGAEFLFVAEHEIEARLRGNAEEPALGVDAHAMRIVVISSVVPCDGGGVADAAAAQRALGE